MHRRADAEVVGPIMVEFVESGRSGEMAQQTLQTEIDDQPGRKEGNMSPECETLETPMAASTPKPLSCGRRGSLILAVWIMAGIWKTIWLNSICLWSEWVGRTP